MFDASEGQQLATESTETATEKTQILQPAERCGRRLCQKKRGLLPIEWVKLAENEIETEALAG
jgi:hypothetical protein